MLCRKTVTVTDKNRRAPNTYSRMCGREVAPGSRELCRLHETLEKKRAVQRPGIGRAARRRG